jgi:hypothetical protein
MMVACDENGIVAPNKKEMHIMEYIIKFTWDNTADVWIATSDDIPGLVLESGSYDALLERVRFAVPELLALNSPKVSPVTLAFLSERRERMVL